MQKHEDEIGKERDGDSKNEGLMDRWIDQILARNNLERKCKNLEGKILRKAKKKQIERENLQRKQEFRNKNLEKKNNFKSIKRKHRKERSRNLEKYI